MKDFGKMCPDGIRVGFAKQGEAMFVPPGWLICDRVLGKVASYCVRVTTMTRGPDEARALAFMRDAMVESKKDTKNLDVYLGIVKDTKISFPGNRQLVGALLRTQTQSLGRQRRR